MKSTRKPPEAAKMGQHRFLGLMRWELEEYVSLPLLAFLVASAIIATLSYAYFGAPTVYYNLFFGSGTVLLIMALVAGAFFARSYAGSIGKGETKLMLSYPVKRSELFLSKFTALFLVVFAIYVPVYYLHVYIDGMTAFDPLVFLTLFGLVLELMLSCSVAVGISMATKNEIMSILATVLLLFGLDSILGYNNPLSAQGRVYYLLQYVGQQLHGTLPIPANSGVTANDTLMAVFVPIAAFVVLIGGSYGYFTRVMEVD
jgi:ABC-type transport system involved in multi-copper enzyme maturation permease subunit